VRAVDPANSERELELPQLTRGAFDKHWMSLLATSRTLRKPTDYLTTKVTSN